MASPRHLKNNLDGKHVQQIKSNTNADDESMNAMLNFCLQRRVRKMHSYKITSSKEDERVERVKRQDTAERKKKTRAPIFPAGSSGVDRQR